MTLIVAGPGSTREARRCRLDVVGLDHLDKAQHLDRIAVLGPDWFLAEVVTRLLLGDREIAVAFGGSRSRLVAMFALDPSPEATVSRLRAGTPYPADVGMVTRDRHHRIFIGGVGAGAASHPGGTFPLRGGRQGVVKVVSPRRSLEVTSRGVLVANGQNWGPWLIAPRAALMDGKLDVQVISGPLLATRRLRRSMVSGMHGRSPLVRRITTEACRIETPSSWQVSVDGRGWGRGPFEVAVDPRKVMLLL